MKSSSDTANLAKQLISADSERIHDAEIALMSLPPEQRTNVLLKAGMLAAKKNYSVARQRLEECASIWRERGDEAELGEVLGELWVMAFEHEDYPTARVAIEEITSLESLQEESLKVAFAFWLGQITQEEGNYSQAQSYYESALISAQKLIFHAPDLKPVIAALTNRMGSLAYEQGDYVLARPYFEEGFRLAESTDDREFIASTRLDLALLESKTGDYNQAITYFNPQTSMINLTYFRSICLDELLVGVNLCILSRQWRRAACLLGVETRLRKLKKEKTRRLLHWRKEYTDCLMATRKELSENEFESAWSEGKKMTLEEATSYALTNYE